MRCSCQGAASRGDLHSFPTRRSSDLGAADLFVNQTARRIAPVRMTGNYGGEILRSIVAFKPTSLQEGLLETEFGIHVQARSEEHTSELQSPMYLVCRLLLEKKKKKID